MRKILFCLFTILIINLLSAETVTLSPSDDMYTDPEHPGTDPLVTELWTANYDPAGHFERIMMRFDLEPYLNRNLISAELHLTRHFSCPSSGTTSTNFYFISQIWNEESWDHTAHISYNSDISIPYVFSGNGGSAITDFDIDVTDFFDNWFDGGEDNYGFVIIAQNNQKWSKFYSKEFSNQSYRPSLVLELENTGIYSDDVPENEIKLCNYPNPFNPITNISYEIPVAEHVTLDIYNSRGQKIITLLNTWQKAGVHNVVWTGCDHSGKSVSSGIYHYRIRAGENSSCKSMQLIK